MERVRPRSLPLALLLLSLGLAGCACRARSPRESERDIPVQVELVGLDAQDSPVVVLKEERGPRLLRIWIGPAEAQSIALEKADRQQPRPNTHDLATRLIHGLEGKLLKVVVTELRDGIFYAILFVESRGRLVEIDARPSDAIAIALRADAPILVRAEVFDAAGELGTPDGRGRAI
jgi:hypothetical protein